MVCAAAYVFSLVPAAFAFRITTFLDEYGNVLKQTIDTRVTNDKKLMSTRIIESENYNNRGDAATQRITTYTTDNDGLNPEVSGYQEILNRRFDSDHNANRNHYAYSGR